MRRGNFNESTVSVNSIYIARIVRHLSTKNMKKFVYQFLIVLLTLPVLLQAQASEEVHVSEVVNRLFTGMHNADSTLVRSAFANEVTMATALRNKEGKSVLIREYSINAFVKAVGQPQKEPLTEEIWNLKIQIDGDLAQAWCDYAFYVGNKFSHCGVDAFQLHKSQEGWKIFHLADTRRNDNCTIPEEIQKKHK